METSARVRNRGQNAQRRRHGAPLHGGGFVATSGCATCIARATHRSAWQIRPPSPPERRGHPRAWVSESLMQAGIYRHYKGGYYQVLGVAADSSNDAPEQQYVVYIALTGIHLPGPRMRIRKRE